MHISQGKDTNIPKYEFVGFVYFLRLIVAKILFFSFLKSKKKPWFKQIKICENPAMFVYM